MTVDQVDRNSFRALRTLPTGPQFSEIHAQLDHLHGVEPQHVGATAEATSSTHQRTRLARGSPASTVRTSPARRTSIARGATPTTLLPAQTRSAEASPWT